MSPRVPWVRPEQVVRALERDGWVRARQRGSHLTLKKRGYPPVAVPMHNRDVRPGTLRSILDDAGLSIERFQELLRS